MSRRSSPSRESPQRQASPMSEVDEIIGDVEKRAAKKLQASNSATAKQIDSLLERLAKLEKTYSDPDEQTSKSWHPAKRTHSEDSADGSAPPSKDQDLDPDKRQEGYVEFLDITEQYLESVGVHTWSLSAASRRQTGCGGACLALVPSILVLVVQFVLLHAISLESLSPTCTTNSDCRSGTWCSPSDSPAGYDSTPGMCDDCAWAGALQASSWEEVQTDNLPGRYNRKAYEAASDTLAVAVAYCAATDIYADRCDFLIDFYHRLTIGPFIVLLCATSLMLMTVVADLDKQVHAAAMFAYRAENVAVYPGLCGISVLVWFIFQLRRFALPGMAAFAYTAIILAGPPSPGIPLPVAFILTAVAVGVIYNMDGLISMAILGDQAKALIRQAFASVEAFEGDKEAYGSMYAPWFHFAFHRFVGVSFGTLILLEVLATEPLIKYMGLFRLDWSELSWMPQPYKACTNIPTMLGFATGLMVVLLMQTWAVGLQMCRSSITTPIGFIVAPLVGAVFIPVLSYALGQVVHWPLS
mmetsp:Transcript_79305/g.224789  ORF Transcript_79305/g.224789 Transcript_79305/m.224789 type:complete len:526 (+) Transcript_79305:118-1695(+)